MRKDMGGKKIDKKMLRGSSQRNDSCLCCQAHVWRPERLTSLLPSTTDCQNKQIAVRAGTLNDPPSMLSVRTAVFVSHHLQYSTTQSGELFLIAMLIRQGKAEGWLQADTVTIRAWLRHNGVKFCAIEPKIIDGRGTALVASEDLQSSSLTSQEILTIPKEMVLSIETVHSHSLFDQDLKQVLESLGDWGRVCLLLLERGC
jgi:hypothetical protein